MVQMRKIGLLIIAFISILSISCSKKSSDGNSQVEPQKPAANYEASLKCGEIENAFEAPAGQSCVTEKGFVFARLQKNENLSGWLDVKNNIFWSDQILRSSSWKKSKSFCAEKGLRLPTKDDFEKSVSAGLEDVFKKKYPETDKGWWAHHNGVWYGWKEGDAFWSSTVDNRRDEKWDSGEWKSDVVFAYVYLISTQTIEGNLPTTMNAIANYDELSFGGVHAVCINAD